MRLKDITDKLSVIYEDVKVIKSEPEYIQLVIGKTVSESIENQYVVCIATHENKDFDFTVTSKNKPTIYNGIEIGYYYLNLLIIVTDDKTYVITDSKPHKIITIDTRMKRFAAAGRSAYLIEADKISGEKARVIQIDEDGKILQDRVAIKWGVWHDVFSPVGSSTMWIKPVDENGKEQESIVLESRGSIETLKKKTAQLDAFNARVNRHFRNGCD